ncbi:HAMP domain-containing sensor histidine kinase [Porticoccus sp.]
MKLANLPRVNSLPGLAFIALLLAVLPLAVALLTSTLYVNRLNQQGQEAIHQATILANASQTMSDSLIAMERSARQYNVLLDKELFNVYLEHRATFNETLRQLADVPMKAGIGTLQQQIREAESLIYEGLQTVLLGTEESAQLLAGFDAINVKVKMIRDEAVELKSRAVEKLQQSARRAKSLMLWQLAGLLPILLFVVYMFAARVLKPIRQLDAAIRRLGRGELDGPVTVVGPHDLQELGLSLDWMRQRITELEGQKTRFLQHMSHELKTPLTSLREGSQLLSEGTLGPLSEDQQEVAELLKHNVLRLQRQIENLLRFSVAQSHQVAVNSSVFPLAELLEEVLRDQQLALQNKSLQLQLETEPLRVTADREKLRTVIDNLLSNAVKYSPQGGLVTVTLALRHQQLEIVVQDSGPGIPEDERERVFEAFYQGSIPARSAVRGSGIGLSVCRAYVHSLGGEIMVQPSSQGARLCVLIPQPQ